MVRYNLRQCLPYSAELPDSDDTPVDNELQNLIPNLLEAILALAWKQREDCFFGDRDLSQHLPIGRSKIDIIQIQIQIQ